MNYAALAHPSVQRFARSVPSSIDSYLKKLADKHLLNGANVGLEQVSLSPEETTVTAVADKLRQYGVVCLKNFIPTDVIDAFMPTVERDLVRIENAMAQPDAADYGEVDGIAWQRNLSQAKNFNELYDYAMPIANIRGSAGSDSGMLDLFHIQKIKRWAALESFRYAQHEFCHGLVAKVVEHISSFRFSGLQLYQNKSVTDTRCFHVDNIFGTYKAFMYLTDVATAGDGPYCYVPGSHKVPFLHRLELRLIEKQGARGRDIWSAKYLPYIKFIASRGTVIISNQTGIHRGFPQSLNHTRRALVANFSDHVELGRKY